MGAGVSNSWNPLALCQNPPTTEDPYGEGYVQYERAQSSTSPLQSQLEDAMIQHAMILSLEEQAKMESLLLSREHDDEELQEALHQSCLSAAGIIGPPIEEISETAVQLQIFLDVLGLKRLDVGSTNLSEGGTMLGNQCFYLAIARSWLAESAEGNGLLVRESALQLKREIEGCVLAVRGDRSNELGDESEAYTDYLSCAMQGLGPAAASAITDLAIVVFASTLGGLEAYEGRGYPVLPREQQVANLALVWHRPGHFEAVIAQGHGGKVDVTLRELMQLAEEQHITTALIRG